MKIYSCFLFMVLVFVLHSSCNKDEGLGGTSSLEGYVYKVEHYDDYFSFRTDTFPAVKEDVYLIFGDNDDYFGDDVDTDQNGFYRFDYLRKGNYRDKGTGTEMRAYIRHAGEVAFFNDTRVGGGIFIFQKLFPGDYEIAVETENANTEKVDLIIRPVTIIEINRIYEIEEPFEVNVAV